MIRGISLALLAAALVGCGSGEPTSANTKIPDPYPGLTGEARVEAIRNDPKLLSAEKVTKISEAQKEAGLPVTGK